MNVTSYSGFPSGADAEFSSGDMGQLRVQDVGEGSVKISSFAGFMTGESLRALLEEHQLFSRFIPGNERVEARLT